MTDAGNGPPIEAQASREPTKKERAIEKLELAVSGKAPVSKNTLIKEVIKILKT